MLLGWQKWIVQEHGRTDRRPTWWRHIEPNEKCILEQKLWGSNKSFGFFTSYLDGQLVICCHYPSQAWIFERDYAKRVPK